MILMSIESKDANTSSICAKTATKRAETVPALLQIDISIKAVADRVRNASCILCACQASQ
jgi:hypothetical protein